MNKDKNIKTDRSPLKIIFLSLYVVLAASYIPLSMIIDLGAIGTTVLAYAFCALSFFAIAYAASSFKGALGYGLSMVVLTFVGFTSFAVAIFAAFVSVSCVYAYLLIKQRTPVLYGIPAIAPLVVLLVTKNPAFALLALLWIPISLLLVYTVKKKLARVSAICHISLGICLAVVSVLVLVILATYKSLTVTSIRSFVETIRVFGITTMTEMFGEFSEMFEQMQVDFSRLIALSVTVALYIIPALIITVANVCAYIMHATLITVCYSKEEDNKEALPMLSFDMSLVSAIVFLIAASYLFLTLLFATDINAMFVAVTGNIAIILAPGLILTALAALKAFTAKKGPSCFGTILYVGVIFMLCSLSPIAIIACAVSGAVIIVLARISKWRAESDKD